MREIVENLRKKSVLTKEDILLFRASIDSRYPEADARKKAALLADWVHKRLNQNMPDFNNQTRAEIRTSLLQRAIVYDDFDIHAGDVFGLCLLLPEGQGASVGTLAEWVNKQQETAVSQHDLQELRNEAQFQARQTRDFDLDSLLKHFERLNAAAVINEKSLGEIPTDEENLAGEATENKQKSRFFVISLACSLLICTFLFTAVKIFVLPPPVSEAKDPVPFEVTHPLPAELQYQEVDTEKLRGFLNKRNSILSDEPYFSAIFQSAKKHNINPLLLFAITGQEQGFVPRNHPQASKIANNPFNVYRSWQDYNTNIQDSANIAALTVVNLSKGRPKNTDPLTWVNRKYSEDNQWQAGVKQLLKELQEEVPEY